MLPTVTERSAPSLVAERLSFRRTREPVALVVLQEVVPPNFTRLGGGIFKGAECPGPSLPVALHPCPDEGRNSAGQWPSAGLVRGFPQPVQAAS
eukprot:2326336-Heterocapsa_arctica.AAC.1